MADPMIIYDDGSTTFTGGDAAGARGSIERLIYDVARAGTPATVDLAAVIMRGDAWSAELAAILTDRKSSSGSNQQWAVAARAPSVLNPSVYPWVACFSTGPGVLFCREIGRHFQDTIWRVVTIQGNTASDTSSGGYSRVLQCPSADSALNPNIETALVIMKTGGDRSVEIIASTDPLFLPKPPQTAFPEVARAWKTYPVVTAQGDFLGSYGRPTVGMLDITIEDVSNTWIREKWEPFREHVSLGGIFAYALDWENDPGNVAFCFARGSVPAPVVKAGGFGSVTLKAGVAHL